MRNILVLLSYDIKKINRHFERGRCLARHTSRFSTHTAYELVNSAVRTATFSVILQNRFFLSSLVYSPLVPESFVSLRKPIYLVRFLSSAIYFYLYAVNLP